MTRRKWTDEELRYVASNSENKSVQELAQAIDRSRNSVSTMLYKLRGKGELKWCNYKHWTEEEDAFICSNRGRMTVDELTDKLNRTRLALKNRIVYLKKIRKIDDVFPRITDEELAILSDPSLCISEKAKALGKSWGATNSACWRRGFTSRKANHPRGKTYKHPAGYNIHKSEERTISGYRRAVHNSREIMERSLGRRLLKSEQVHHINMDKGDDRPDNLFVCTNSEHQECHGSLNALVKRLLEENVIKFDKEKRIYLMKQEEI